MQSRDAGRGSRRCAGGLCNRQKTRFRQPLRGFISGSLELTLDLISNHKRDFALWNERAGGLTAPKVAAIVMTMAGAKSQKKSTPDRASRMYIERTLAIAEKHAGLFDYHDVRDAFVITDDFVSTGRISGAKSIPIACLKVGSFHSVEGQRLQVNQSAERYKRELKYLVSII